MASVGNIELGAPNLPISCAGFKSYICWADQKECSGSRRCTDGFPCRFHGMKHWVKHRMKHWRAASVTDLGSNDLKNRFATGGFTGRTQASSLAAPQATLPRDSHCGLNHPRDAGHRFSQDRARRAAMQKGRGAALRSCAGGSPHQPKQSPCLRARPAGAGSPTGQTGRRSPDCYPPRNNADDHGYWCQSSFLSHQP